MCKAQSAPASSAAGRTVGAALATARDLPVLADVLVGRKAKRGIQTPAGCEHHRMLLIAHAGHTLTTIAYFVPVVAFLVWLLATQIRERRRTRG
jgi:hypothetical protein